MRDIIMVPWQLLYMSWRKVLPLHELELLFIVMCLTSYFRLKPLVSLVQLTELFILTFYGKHKMDVTWSREQILIANVSLSYSV